MRAEKKRTGIRELLLTRRGLAFVESRDAAGFETQARAVELELAAIGYVISERLRRRLADSPLDELARFRAWALETLLEHAGGNRKHVPLFRRFPDGIPEDTGQLWWSKVLVHFLQAENQPCLYCARVGTTHVLSPCRHVVCDRCFDGSSYSACPVCEHRVDADSPFFQPAEKRVPGVERVRFRMLDLGEELPREVRALFSSLCERKQAMSPADREALVTIVRDSGGDVLDWLPAEIPVRENVALVFGTLLQAFDPAQVMPHAQRFLKTATDVLRLVAVMSGTDGSLQTETIFRSLERKEAPPRYWGRIADLIGVTPPESSWQRAQVAVQVHRFKVAKLSRALRRALLGQLESLHPDALTEDMLRHQSYWVWLGEFLHPHEYAARFPKVARAFQVVRGKGPDGLPAPAFRTWHSKVDGAIGSRDMDVLLRVLLERPGEFVRRLDHVLRIANTDEARSRVLEAFRANITRFATPVLLTLKAHLPLRAEKSVVRVYWPKGRVARGVSSPDARRVLPQFVIDDALAAIDAELLARFSSREKFAQCLLDEALRNVMVPFNERTAARSAVNLPRGSRMRVAAGKTVRLFLHWCQPENVATPTDLDLSVAFYDTSWKYRGVCSYYELTTTSPYGIVLARSSGDLRNAPWPLGATEFVDLEAEAAVSEGIRFAVMVVTNYSGFAFSQLEHGFAGLMMRDDPGGLHFDPRTVDLKFALEGESGVFTPLVLDLEAGEMHWLDVHSRGMPQFNNVANSSNQIAKICPDQMQYFASGARASMFELGLLHAAARCQRVFRRDVDGRISGYRRREGETAVDFYQRLRSAPADVAAVRWPPADGADANDPAIALLFRGDIDLPDRSCVYALFRERVTPSLAASDLLS